MTQKGAIKWATEIKAFQEGKQIQRQTRCVWFDEKSPRFEEDVEYRIKPESPKRLPTIEEVEQWFLENKVFKHKSTKTFYRSSSFNNISTTPIYIYGEWNTIDKLCMYYTHYDGSELYITE